MDQEYRDDLREIVSEVDHTNAGLWARLFAFDPEGVEEELRRLAKYLADALALLDGVREEKLQREYDRIERGY